VLVGDNSALRELAICRQEKKTFGKPAYDCGFTVCQSEVGLKPAWGRLLPESASILQPHWHRHLDVKRPSRAAEELHQVAATRTERRLFAQVDFRREMRPIAFVDPGRLSVRIRRTASVWLPVA